MPKLNDPQAAQFALLVMCAEDMYMELADINKANPAPPVDPRVAANWNVLGFITAVDALLDAQTLGCGDRFFYGFLACSKTDSTQYIAVIRGTANASEWIEDIEFIPQPAPANMAGMIENGFFSIYQSMQLCDAAGKNPQPVVSGLAAVVGSNQLTVLGHSLGSALATYLTLDLTLSGKFPNPVTACLFASPHTGDGKFAAFFDSKVASYKVYNYARDIVPRVPFALGYSALPKALEFSSADANAVIQSTLGGNHHAICYAAMLDYTTGDWKSVPNVDQSCAVCILGPNP